MATVGTRGFPDLVGEVGDDVDEEAGDVLTGNLLGPSSIFSPNTPRADLSFLRSSVLFYGFSSDGVGSAESPSESEDWSKELLSTRSSGSIP